MNESLATAALTLVFAASLAVVYAVGDPFLWVGWAAAMIVAAGAALVRFNR